MNCGSGTDPVEGSSLAISVLEYLNKLGCITVATTHYQELKQYALVTQGFKNASSEFDIENLKPTYKLLIGVPGKSNAFAISKKLGLSDKIINRAKSILNEDTINIEDLLKRIYDDKSKIEKEKENIEKNSIQIELIKRNLEKEKEVLDSRKIEIIEKAKIEARNVLLKAKEEANEIIREINMISKDSSKNANKQFSEIRNKLNDSIKENTSSVFDNTNNKKEEISPDKIEIGMEVFVDTVKQYATVLSKPDKSNQVQVQIGISKMKVNINCLSIHKNSNKKENIPINKKRQEFSPKQISNEINVIGLNVEEAIFVIDKYLDDVAIANLNNVRIVHGKGTGVLRKGIHNFLKKHPHVKSYRMGNFGEGEMGATVVEIK